MSEKPEVTLVRIEERLMAHDRKQDELIEQLFGNGQPGVISKMNRRLSRLEIWIAIAMGGGLVIIWILERARAVEILIR